MASNLVEVLFDTGHSAFAVAVHDADAHAFGAHFFCHHRQNPMILRGSRPIDGR